MDHQWRLTPATQGNICPMCSISHFPFCPPFPPPLHLPPYAQNPRFPPPPPPDYPRPDPYHQALHNSYPSDGWHTHNNYNHREGFDQPIYNDYSNSTSNSYLSEVDRSHKRPRVDEVGSSVFGYENYHQNPAMASMNDERRLKLIRDHGGVGSGERNHQDSDTIFVRNIDMNSNSNGNKKMYSPFQPHAVEVDNASFGNHDLQRNHSNGSVSSKGPQYYSQMNNWQAEVYLPGCENRVFGGHPPPPLPASPPPPLPMEPPVVRSLSEFKAYPSAPKTSLFPVPVGSSTMPYLHNKSLSHPRGSTGFVSEVLLLFCM